MPVPILWGIPIEGWSLEKVIEHVSKRETGSGPSWIVTANPEILLHARRDAQYAEVIKSANLRVVDGFGLYLVLRRKGGECVRVTGVELAESLVALAWEKGWKVGLYGGWDKTAEQVAAVLRSKFQGLSVAFEFGGSVSDDGTDDSVGEEAWHRMMLEAPDILLVALGGGPKQERWIANHLSDLPNARAVVGVGGTFDFWSGKTRRAPIFFQRLGLEWLWRLFCEPRRWKRIWNATVVFLMKAMKDGRR